MNFKQYYEEATDIDNIKYHVTYTDKVPSIKKGGIKPFQTTNWVDKDGNRLGTGEIYSFNNIKDAIRWGSEMDWRFNKDIGTGKISIVKFNDEDEWEIDDKTPLYKAGDWLKKMKVIKPDQIIDIIPVTTELLSELK